MRKSSYAVGMLVVKPGSSSTPAASTKLCIFNSLRPPPQAPVPRDSARRSSRSMQLPTRWRCAATASPIVRRRTRGRATANTDPRMSFSRLMTRCRSLSLGVWHRRVVDRRQLDIFGLKTPPGQQGRSSPSMEGGEDGSRSVRGSATPALCSCNRAYSEAPGARDLALCGALDQRIGGQRRVKHLVGGFRPCHRQGVRVDKADLDKHGRLIPVDMLM